MIIKSYSEEPGVRYFINDLFAFYSINCIMTECALMMSYPRVGYLFAAIMDPIPGKDYG